MRIGVDIEGTSTDFVVYRPETNRWKPLNCLLLPHKSAEAMLAERRARQPYRLENGQPRASGQNLLIRKGRVSTLPGKGTFNLQEGDILSIHIPGGGGYGQPKKE